METTFMDLSRMYKGKRLCDDFETIGNKVLEPYGLEVVFGDQQVMVLLAYEEYEDQSFYNAYACAMWMDEDTLEIENIHVEFFARYPEEKYDRFRYNLTDEEYDRGIMIMKEFMDAVTE